MPRIYSRNLGIGDNYVHRSLDGRLAHLPSRDSAVAIPRDKPISAQSTEVAAVRSIEISISKILRYATLGAIIVGAAPYLASHMTGTYDAMKPIADDAVAALPFTVIGAGLGITLGFFADGIFFLRDSYFPRNSERKEPIALESTLED